jgi:hypothetical protein
VRASDDALWHIGQTSPNAEWSGWASLEAPFLPVTGTFVGIMPNLAVAQQGEGSIDVFVRGADGNIWFIGQTSPNGGFGGWLSLGTPPGGRVLGDLIVAQNRDGSLEVFVRGEWGLLWHAKETAPNTNDFSRWMSLGGEGLAWDRPAVGQNADGRLEVFVPGFGQLHQRKQRTVGAW